MQTGTSHHGQVGDPVNTTLQHIALLAAAMRAYDRVHTVTVCDTCGATWETVDGDTCNWCTTALDNQRRWQAELTLTPPDNTDPDDQRYDGIMQAWADRLETAVEAEIITAHQAERAWGTAA